MSRTAVQRLGYTVALIERDEGDVYYVEGFGISLYVEPDDAETWASLANAEAHTERTTQAEQALQSEEPAP